MAIAKLVRKVKRPYGLWVKMTAVTMLGLCFIFVWGVFSNSSSSITTQRESFEDIIEPSSSSSTSSKGVQTQTQLPHKKEETKAEEKQNFGGVSNKEKDVLGEDEKNGNSSATVHQEHDKGVAPHKRVHKNDKDKYKVRANEVSESDGNDESEDKEEKEESEGELEGEKEGSDRDGEVGVDFEMDDGGDSGLAESLDQDSKLFEDGGVGTSKGQFKGPLFDPNASYKWKLCSTRSKHNYIPCIDIEVGGGKVQSYRHTERSCPRAPVMCLVPLPHGGYGYSQPWPESKSKILFKNVAHPRLAAYMKKHSWLVESGEYLTFPQNQSEFKGGIQHYLESIEEMVPDIEWGKTIRVVLEIGCSDSSFVVALLDKDVLTLTLGLKHDLVDLAQVALERGFPAVVSPFGRRRLPFPSQAFDAIHCGGCSIPWHSNGGKLLFEMNRILRPSGYFIMSTKHDSIEEEEGWSIKVRLSFEIVMVHDIIRIDRTSAYHSITIIG
ncbi:probable methyltransferase PMT28 [Arachis ipaensis]|uniref:probable methyltransferase PMT28 n=1 Tax=Arachis ipaensis TaxID=130454 RepID=UPI000A2B58AD|nr:probable methyltransferase PMT28 [Arachis ipaensis]